MYLHKVWRNWMVSIRIWVLLTECLPPVHCNGGTLAVLGTGRDETSDVTVYPKKYAHGFVVLCFVVVMQSFIMNSHEVFIHIHQGCFAGTGAIVRLPQCQWSKPDGYGKISQCITKTNTAKQKPCAYFLGYTVSTVLGVENTVRLTKFVMIIGNRNTCHDDLCCYLLLFVLRPVILNALYVMMCIQNEQRKRTYSHTMK